jgi:hypothetical protein
MNECIYTSRHWDIPWSPANVTERSLVQRGVLVQRYRHYRQNSRYGIYLQVKHGYVKADAHGNRPPPPQLLKIHTFLRHNLHTIR